MPEPATSVIEGWAARMRRRARMAGWRDAALSGRGGSDLRGAVAGWLFLIGFGLILIGMALARWDVQPGLAGDRPLPGIQGPGLPGRVASWHPPPERRPG